MREFSYLNSAACGSQSEEKDAAQEPYSRHGAEETLKGGFKNNECDEVLFPPSQNVAPIRIGEDRDGVDAANEQEGGRALTALDIARDYVQRGWNPVPVPHGEKAPTDRGWQNRVITEENVARYFNGQLQNIGVILGPTSGGLTDVDLDCPEAIKLAPDFLPETNSIFGRASKPKSHHLYRTSLAETLGKAVLQFRDPTTGTMLVELRAGGESGAQTILPGSIHESGEPIKWDQDGEPAKVNGEELRERVAALAAATLLARHWPGEGGRHDTALALGSILGRAGFNEVDIGEAIGVIARVARDPEAADRIRAAKASAAARANDKKAYGLPKLIELLGEPVATRAAEWLGLNEGPFGPGASSPERTAGQAGIGADRQPKYLSHQGVISPIERDPLQIVPDLEAAPAFPVDHLPPILRGAVEALEEDVQAPHALCAHSVLGAAALATQGHANVKVPCLATPRPLSLFMLAIAESGERKSTCDDVALAPVRNHEDALAAVHSHELKHFENEKAVTADERRKIEKDGTLSPSEKCEALDKIPEPQKPREPFLRLEEPTYEGLFNFLDKGQPSIGLFTSEGGQFIGGHGMSTDARTRMMTGLAKLWDCGAAQRVRAKEITRISGRRLSISLAAQPKIAAMLLGDELAHDQGFLGRFLITCPASTIGNRKIREAQVRGDPRLRAFHERLAALLNKKLPLRDGSNNELYPPNIILDEDAWRIWQSFAQSLEDDCGPEGRWRPVKAAALKMAENVARIAGILTLFDDPEVEAINGDMMEAAVEIGFFYLQEALRLVGHEALDSETQAVHELEQWLTRKWPHPLISPTHIDRNAPRHLRARAEKTQKRVRALLAAGVLELVGKAEIGGKTFREAYRIIKSDAETEAA